MCKRTKAAAGGAALVILALFIDERSALPLSSQVEKDQASVRASLITKHNLYRLRNYASNREKKSAALLPQPMVVTTKLAVKNEAPGWRVGRSYSDVDGNTVVEGVRVPDDETDRITWRNGRVINNIFVPNGQKLPPEVVVSSARRPRMSAGKWAEPLSEGRGFPTPAFNYDEHYVGRTRDLPDSLAMESRTAEVALRPDGSQVSLGEARAYPNQDGSAESGRPVYYLDEEPDSLHADRSPYDFEPADARPSVSSAVASGYARPGDFAGLGLGGASAPADSNDFVIKQHSYVMCAGCPSFSIPIPVPKSTLQAQPPVQVPGEGYNYYQNEDFATGQEPFLQRVGSQIVSTFKNVQTSAMKMLDPIMKLAGVDDNYLEPSSSSILTEKIGGAALTSEAEKSDDTFNVLPVVVGGMAAAALGALAFASRTPSIEVDSNSRSLNLLPQEEGTQTAAVLKHLTTAREKYGSKGRKADA